jgi:hypothetical protein
VIFSTVNTEIMDQNNPLLNIKDPVGMVGGAVLLAPIGIPVLHGLFGLAVVGLGIFTAGAIVTKTAEALSGSSKSKSPEEDPL